MILILQYRKDNDDRMALADKWGGYRAHYPGGLVFLWPPPTKKEG